MLTVAEKAKKLIWSLDVTTSLQKMQVIDEFIKWPQGDTLSKIKSVDNSARKFILVFQWTNIKK